MTARKVDENGYITIERNPISRTGVFEYSGASIGGDADPSRIYQVYRAPEVLEQAAPSFGLVPLINDHTWLGEGGVAPEAKGVHGTLGEKVEFDPADGVLYADMKIWSDTLAGMIDAGKTDLSLGYHCEYAYEPGIAPDGTPYEYVQKSMRGNHIALVDEARCAVAVLDHLVPTCDSLEVAIMAKEKTTPEATPAKKFEVKPTPALDAAMGEPDAGAESASSSLTLEQVGAAMQEMAPIFKQIMEFMSAMTPPPVVEEEELDTAAPDVPTANPASGDVPNDEVVDGGTKAALSAMDAKIVAQAAEIETLKKGGVKTLLSEISQRDTLAKRLSDHIGTFDHAEMTLGEVAKYGVSKLGLKVSAGQEFAALEGFLHAKPVFTPAMDDRPRSGLIDSYLTPKEV